jgi:hypothetical protein
MRGLTSIGRNTRVCIDLIRIFPSLCRCIHSVWRQLEALQPLARARQYGGHDLPFGRRGEGILFGALQAHLLGGAARKGILYFTLFVSLLVIECYFICLLACYRVCILEFLTE